MVVDSSSRCLVTYNINDEDYEAAQAVATKEGIVLPLCHYLGPLCHLG